MLGIHPALMTAYTAHGDIDLRSTVDLAESLVDRGVHGLFLGGTAGEGPLQTVDERRAVTEAVADRVGGRTSLITHVGALPYRDTVALGTHAHGLGFRVAAIPPLYYAMSDDTVLDFYRALADDLGAPVIAYHVPHLTHRAMSAPAMATLAREGVLSGVKFSAENRDELVEVLEATRELPFDLLSGSDPLCLLAARHGSSGAVGVSINAMPDTFVSLWESHRRGDEASAELAQSVVTRFVDLMFRYEFIAFLRHVLSLQGIEIGANRRPLPNLSPEQKSEITTALRDDEELRVALSLD